MEPAGIYTVFLAAVVPGGFVDGMPDPRDLVGIDVVTFTLTPRATLLAKPSPSEQQDDMPFARAGAM